jgi:CheY-like chemotaxis protein
VRADPSQIEQVIVNLAANARDAMPGGGTLSIEVACGTVPAGEGEASLLTVRDTGSGMDPETLRRAFDPFITTKEPGKGTGLGLATVYGIVKRLGGGVTLESSPGTGTVARVWFPRCAATPSAAPDAAGLPAAGGSESILVVEDEAAVSNLVVRVLRDKGYRVTLATDGEAAYRRWLVEDGAFDLVVTDVVMPRMGGAELFRALRSEGYSPRMLFCSGYTDEALAGLRALGEEIDLLPKPFTAEQLVGRVRLALDRPRKPTQHSS